MNVLVWLLIAAAVFGICYGVDKLFQKLFRSKAQHMSGLAVRVSKRYGLFGVILLLVGIFAQGAVEAQGMVMRYGGIFVLLLGLGMIVYYLSTGIFYDSDGFLVSAFAKKDRAYRYNQIQSQKLYVLTGGQLIVELSMTDGSAVSVVTTMDGAEKFLDTAFSGWCRQRNIRESDCAFHDKEKSWWFPHEEES